MRERESINHTISAPLLSGFVRKRERAHANEPAQKRAPAEFSHDRAKADVVYCSQSGAC